jgi:hypothetical protein
MYTRDVKILFNLSASSTAVVSEEVSSLIINAFLGLFLRTDAIDDITPLSVSAGNAAVTLIKVCKFSKIDDIIRDISGMIEWKKHQ